MDEPHLDSFQSSTDAGKTYDLSKDSSQSSNNDEIYVEKLSTLTRDSFMKWKEEADIITHRITKNHWPAISLSLPEAERTRKRKIIHNTQKKFNNDKNKYSYYCNDEGKLYRKSAISDRIEVITDFSTALKILHKYHDECSTGGHKGQKSVQQKITRLYFWPNITKHINAYVQTCPECQEDRLKHLQKSPLQPIIVEKPMDLVSMGSWGFDPYGGYGGCGGYGNFGYGYGGGPGFGSGAASGKMQGGSGGIERHII